MKMWTIIQHSKDVSFLSLPLLLWGKYLVSFGFGARGLPFFFYIRFIRLHRGSKKCKPARYRGAKPSVVTSQARNGLVCGGAKVAFPPCLLELRKSVFLILGSAGLPRAEVFTGEEGEDTAQAY